MIYFDIKKLLLIQLKKIIAIFLVICFSIVVVCLYFYTYSNPKSKTDIHKNLKAEKNNDPHHLLFVRIKINQVVTRFIQLQKTDQRRKELTSQSLTNSLEFLIPPGYYNNLIRPPIV